MHKYFLITIILGVSLCKCQTTLSFEKFPKQVFDGSAADHSIQRTKRSTPCNLSPSTTDKINSSISQVIIFNLFLVFVNIVYKYFFCSMNLQMIRMNQFCLLGQTKIF